MLVQELLSVNLAMRVIFFKIIQNERIQHENVKLCLLTKLFFVRHSVTNLHTYHQDNDNETPIVHNCPFSTYVQH